jgi:2-haloalkanoic acid dehalogenase type II
VRKVVFFDGDQTLWDFRTVMRRALAATIDELRSLHPDRADRWSVDELIADRDEVASLCPIGTDVERIRRDGFARSLERLGLNHDGLAEHLTAFYLERRYSGIVPYPDVVPALEVLRARYRVALLSNGNSLPEHAGIGGHFDSVVFASQHGLAKPDRGLFDAAAAQVGSAPTDCAMVGDSIDNDVVGAQQAGWTAIWLNRDAAPRPDGAVPDATIRTLAELDDVLRLLLGE